MVWKFKWDRGQNREMSEDKYSRSKVEEQRMFMQTLGESTEESIRERMKERAKVYQNEPKKMRDNIQSRENIMDSRDIGEEKR